MWFLESGPAHGLLAVLADAPVYRWTLDELFDRQGWGVVHDSAQPTGYLAVDAGWGFDDGYGLLLYLDDSVLTMLTAVLGHHGDDERRMPLARVLWTVSQRYGRLAQVDGGYAWDTGNGRLLIAPESGVITAVWATRRVLADPAGLRTVGLSMRVLEQMVTSAAGGPGWADAVVLAAQMVPDHPRHDRWELTAAVALMVDVTAKERGIAPSQVRRKDIAEPLAKVLGAAPQPPATDQPQ